MHFIIFVWTQGFFFRTYLHYVVALKKIHFWFKVLLHIQIGIFKYLVI